jgi:hypothetical protein
MNPVVRGPSHEDHRISNSETLISTLAFRLFRFHEFTSCDDMQLCCTNSKIPMFCFIEIPKCQLLTRFPTLAPQLGLLPLRDFNSIEFYVHSMPPIHLTDFYGPTLSSHSFINSRFMISQVAFQSLRGFHLRNPEIGIRLQIQRPLWLGYMALLLLSLEPFEALIVTSLLLHEI